ncbi:hypothetical protein BB934_36680 (plasmid) [Microvirga ossetica]|uniref:DUF6894 domain-containing protein n=1 Tax=Microvirga ossetica TaxID=1882682 RepID=A0A1B2EUZ2_9HYPH|nr:hypothetical protein BB934_36680 [Microvirga ossetica]
MRCYFHLSNDRELLADPYGIGVTDLTMAHAEALRVIEELLQEDPALEQDLSGWSLLVADGAGKSLLSLPLAGSLQSNVPRRLTSCLN